MSENRTRILLLAIVVMMYPKSYPHSDTTARHGTTRISTVSVPPPVLLLILCHVHVEELYDGPQTIGDGWGREPREIFENREREKDPSLVSFLRRVAFDESSSLVGVTSFNRHPGFYSDIRNDESRMYEMPTFHIIEYHLPPFLEKVCPHYGPTLPFQYPYTRHEMQVFAFFFFCILSVGCILSNVSAWSLNNGEGISPSPAIGVIGRRELGRTVTSTAAGVLLSSTAGSSPTYAATTTTTTTTTTTKSNGLAAKLVARDPKVLTNSVFNVPPSTQVYPNFMRGKWDVQMKFAGFLFPSEKISKDKIFQNVLIPGFQKCSIAALCDVGKDATYEMTIDELTGLEDRSLTLTSQINGFLGYSAIKEILYNPKSNPNRLSIDFIDYQTTNAERIELFCNARESEWIPETGVFVCSEYIRQVTFGTGNKVGIPRQVGGNYAHFWTWRSDNGSADSGENQGSSLRGNLLTAAYLDPQDAMYFDEPIKPVAIYSHILTATKKKMQWHGVAQSPP